MKTRSILLVLMLAVGARLQAQLPAAYAAQLKYTLDSLCAKYKVKGASAAVYVPGYGTWESTWGESHAGVPITSAMALPVNSNTKTYVAAAMLKLQEAGSLSLDDSIGKWIHNKPNISGKITIRQMLNHTSGLYSYTDSVAFSDSLEADFSRVWMPDEMLRFVGPPVFAPGTSWSYSNTNYLLAGMIIAQVSGKPIEKAIRDFILTPQGLGSTWFYPQEQPTASIPHFWFSGGGGNSMDGIVFGYTPEGFYSAANSAGALFATAKDNVMFWQKLCSGQIINAGSLAEWRSTIALNSSIGYGLGMFRYRNFNNRVVYEHGGTGAGAINENLVDSASGVCISLLTNQETVDNNTQLNIILKALHKITITPPTTVAGIAPAAEWKLFPQPAVADLHLSGEVLSRSGLRFTIRDMTGRTVHEAPLSGSVISLDAMSNGTYWLELRNPEGTFGQQRFELIR